MLDEEFRHEWTKRGSIRSQMQQRKMRNHRVHCATKINFYNGKISCFRCCITARQMQQENEGEKKSQGRKEILKFSFDALENMVKWNLMNELWLKFVIISCSIYLFKRTFIVVDTKVNEISSVASAALDSTSFLLLRLLLDFHLVWGGGGKLNNRRRNENDD